MSGAKDQVETYLGDSISARWHEGCVILWKEFSDGRRQEIAIDPLVLSEFLDWLEENDLIHDPWKWEG